MKYLLYSLLMMCLHTAYAQEPAMLWMKGIGGTYTDNINSFLSVTHDSNYVLMMTTNSLSSTGNMDSFCSTSDNRTMFTKINSGSSIEWTKCYAQSLSDTAFLYLYQLLSGDYVAGGINFYAGTYRIQKERYDGSIIWSYGYGGSSTQLLNSMIKCDDGGYIMFGEAYSSDGDVGMHYGSASDRDMWALKVDSNGTKVWSKVIGGTGDERGAAIVEGPQSGCYVIGRTPSNDYDCTGNHGGFTGSTDAYVARLDKYGNILWHKNLGGTGYDYGSCGWTDGNGGLLLGGVSGSTDGDVHHQINSGGLNVWLVHIDSSGNILWENCYGGGGNEYPNGVCYATDGSIWLACTSIRDSYQVHDEYGMKDAWIVHVENNGTFLGSKVLGSRQNDQAMVIYPLTGGTVLVGGLHDSTGGSFPALSYGGTDGFVAVFAPWTTGVEYIQQKELGIYPNPAHGKVNIKTVGVCAIYDMLGRTAYTGAVAGDEEINISQWQPGMYYVHMGSVVQKLVVY